MSKAKYHLTVSSAQMIDGQLEAIKEDHEASYLFREDKHYFSYEKSDEDGKKVNVLMTIAPGIMTMKQSGNINSIMTFKYGEKYANRYNTPFGSFDMITDTTEFEFAVVDDTITLKLTYFLQISGSEPIKTTINLKATPV